MFLMTPEVVLTSTDACIHVHSHTYVHAHRKKNGSVGKGTCHASLVTRI